MKSLKVTDTLGKETKLKAANGDIWQWTKSAINAWGKKCGIASKEFPLMTGDKGKRRWFIAGVPSKKNKHKTPPFFQMLERLYMAKGSDQVDDKIFDGRTQIWTQYMQS